MKFEKFKISDPERQITKPSIQLSGIGCGLEDCHCSPDYFLSVSDGKNGLLMTLTKKEYLKIRNARESK